MDNNYINEEIISETLQNEVTFGYKATLPLESLWVGGGDTPLITLRRDIEFMKIHPVVSAGMEYYCSGIAGAQFWGGEDLANPQNIQGKPISNDDSVSKFVLDQCQAFWQKGVPHIQNGGYPYGWAAGEHVYREEEGFILWSYIKDVHPYDASILTVDYKPVGVRIKSIRNREPVDLWFCSKSVPAKACWYAHQPKFGQLYGTSQLIGAWRPWRRLGWRDGVEQVIDAAIYRAGYKGPIVGHPPEDMQSNQPTATTANSTSRRSARDVARQMVEWAKSGAGFTKSTAKYPPSQGGGDKWTIEFPDHVMDVRPLIESARYLEDQILLGLGVPPELIRAGGVGSGYAGRSIPREAFLEGQQKIANSLLKMFVTQVLKPLVLWNFGDIPFNIECKSLLKSQTDTKQGTDVAGMGSGDKNYRRSQAAKDAWARRKIAKGLPEQPQRQIMKSTEPQKTPINPTPAAFSIDQENVSAKVLDIIRKVLLQN